MVWFGLWAKLRHAQGLYLTLLSGISVGKAQDTIRIPWYCTWFGSTQGKHPTCCTINHFSPAVLYLTSRYVSAFILNLESMSVQVNIKLKGSPEVFPRLVNPLLLNSDFIQQNYATTKFTPFLIYWEGLLVTQFPYVPNKTV